MTKVGLLVECGRAGLEVVVCRKLQQLIAADSRLELELEIVPMGNKVYVDVEYARRIADCLMALNRLRKCETFRRFEARINGSL